MQLRSKINRLIDVLRSKGCEACLLEDPIDLFYFCGFSPSAGTLFISPQKTVLFVDSRYIAAAKQKQTIEVVLKEQFRDFLLGEKITSIAFDSAKTSVESWQQKTKEFTGIKWINVPFLTKTLRVIKDEDEQKKMRNAADLSKKAFRCAIEELKEGVSELEIAWIYEKYCREHGAEKLSFTPIVAFGENSAFPHHRASKRKLKNNEVVLIDVGCVLDFYSSDMTRTLIGPHADPKIQELGEVVERAQNAALKLCRPGIKAKELDIIVREEMRKADVESLFTHSLGHGIGLETHEYPLISSKRGDAETILEEGMMVTIEPGLYLPGIGGVRREDTVLLTKNGIENLYGDLP